MGLIRKKGHGIQQGQRLQYCHVVLTGQLTYYDLEQHRSVQYQLLPEKQHEIGQIGFQSGAQNFSKLNLSVPYNVRK